MALESNFELDPYVILGISNTAQEEDVRRAYRRLAQRFHPDVNPHNPGAEQQFRDISTAHNILLDKKLRREYDEWLAQRREENKDAYFTLRVTPSKRAVKPLPEEQVIYLLAEINAAPTAKEIEKSDIGVNLTLVLDRSKSMDGSRLERVKIAAQKIIENLSEKDTLSVVTFNDRPTVIIPPTPVTENDKPDLRARVSMMRAKGGTEIFKGLQSGVTQNLEGFGNRNVNHIILLTDGHTYGDQERSMELAKKVSRQGIAISALGLGQDWNDKFLDELASSTGGTTTFVKNSRAVVDFMDDYVRNLSKAFAERLVMSVATDPDVTLEMAFKLAPSPQPLTLNDGMLPLASLQIHRPIMVLFQFQMPSNMKVGFRSIARLVANGDILQSQHQAFHAVSDLSIEVTETPPMDDPPPAIMDALSKLTLYRLQEKAQAALERGDVEEATRRLENLATRLLEIGEESLANQTLSEVNYIHQTHQLTAGGQKTLKYNTRALMTAGLSRALSQALFAPED